jgi:hypothetical protein
VTAYRTELCRSPKCRAPIVWAKTTPGGKFMPVDAEPVADGMVELLPPGPLEKAPRAQVHSADAPPMLATGTLHHSHFATCPDAAAFRARG